jgi:hypothetical protein
MPTEPDPITLSEVVRRATEIVDPNGVDDDVTHFYTQLEDDDRPITTVQNLEERLAFAQEGLETDADNPAIDIAVATVLYLAHRRDELEDDAEDVLRLTARAEWKGHPPAAVQNWLEERGVTV